MKNSILLNIGLNVTGETAVIPVDVALEVLTKHFTYPSAHRFLSPVDHLHGTDYTLVARVNVPHLSVEGVRRAIYNLSTELRQDCIAVTDGDGLNGELIGPRPYDEGFNPKYFRRLDGEPLTA